MVSEAYSLVNNAWKQTTKILFGQEIGELEEFDGYLGEALIGRVEPSVFSGKPVFLTSKHYEGNFFDFEKDTKSATNLLSKPVDINKIKDIDSLFEAVEEKLIYSGNKVLGNSKFVENSDNITDSNFVLNSSMIFSGKYMAYCYMMRKNDRCFAATSSGDSSMLIRCFYNNSLKRCFECVASVDISDCYYCNNVLASRDCMFSFNVRAKANLIGNVQLTKDQYFSLKTKLLGEITSDLLTKKRTHSLVDFLAGDGA
jgi:hypothetical protein